VSVITLDVGGLDLEPDVSAAGHADPRPVGERRYAFNGRERSMIRAELMVVALTLVNLTQSDAKAIRDLFALAVSVPCSGDAFNNASATVQCSGEITDEMEQGSGYWVLNVTLTEVSAAGTASGL
jgi:hypothetical protein